MSKSSALFNAVLAATVVCLVGLLVFVFTRVPPAQAAAGGLAQKIFYFHVPAAYAMYLSGVVCFVASAGYLLRLTERWNAWAQTGAECAAVFGLMVLTSGPLWAKKAWGFYWSWEPRVVTPLLSLLIYGAIVMLRRFGGRGEAENKFAAALGVLGTVNLPIIHLSVKLWGGNHPAVITNRGGGLSHPDMRLALLGGFITMTLLAAVLLWARAKVLIAEARLRGLEERALASEGLGEEH